MAVALLASVLVGLVPTRVAAAVRPPLRPAVNTAACSQSETTDINAAVASATAYLANATNYFDATRSGSRYTSWFGAMDQTRWNHVKATYQAIEDMVIAGSIAFHCGDPTCTNSVYAFVYPSDTSTHTVYLCGAFWTAPTSGTDSKAGTLIHEWTHYNDTGTTSDHQYGKTGAGTLALSNPTQAVDNADNYEYFAENTPATVEPLPVVTTNTHDFGTVNVGSSSSSFTFTVNNGGDGNLSISQVAVSAPYSLTSNTCTSGAVTPSSSCTLAVVFSPTSAGSAPSTITVTSNAGPSTFTLSVTGVGQASTPTPTPPSSATSLSTLSPQRLFDTRTGVGGVPAQRVGSSDGSAGALTVNVLGKAGLPSSTSQINSVVLNVTVTAGTNPARGGGYVTVYPCASGRPNSSNLNFEADQTIPNSVVAPIDGAGNICFYVYGTAHLLADVSGYFSSASAMVAMYPNRILDTRSGSQIGALDGTGEARIFNVLGQGGLPSTPGQMNAVILNVTVTNTEKPLVGGGYVTVYPCASGRPNSSSLNFEDDQTIPNSVIAPVDPAGNICFYVYGKAHVLADINGYFPTGSSLTALPPARILDTRSELKVGASDGSGAPHRLNVHGQGGLPASGIGAVVLNVTVTGGENPSVGGGYVSVYPCASGRPSASSLNFEADHTIPNSVIAPVDSSGNICFYVYGQAHLLADVSGYFPT